MSDGKNGNGGDKTPEEKIDALEHIVKRKSEKVEKQQKEIEEKSTQYEDLAAQVKALQEQGVGGVDEKALEEKITAKIHRDYEINQFVTGNPDFKDYEDAVRGLYKEGHLSESVNVKSAFDMAAGDALRAMGTAAKKEAVEQAAAEASGGGAPVIEDGDQEIRIDDMSDEEFKAYKNSIAAQS